MESELIITPQHSTAFVLWPSFRCLLGDPRFPLREESGRLAAGIGISTATCRPDSGRFAERTGGEAASVDIC